MNAVARFLMGLFLRWERLTYRPDPEWTPDDQRAWMSFLQTPAGQKLDLLMTNQSIESCRQATQNWNHAEAACGYASGHRAAWAWAKTFSALHPPEVMENTGESPDGRGEKP